MNKTKLVIGVSILVSILLAVGLIYSYTTINTLKDKVEELEYTIDNYECNCDNSIYDVNRNGVVNFQDAGLCHVYITQQKHTKYGDLLYDVNCDGVVNIIDSNEIWNNRD